MQCFCFWSLFGPDPWGPKKWGWGPKFGDQAGTKDFFPSGPSRDQRFSPVKILAQNTAKIDFFQIYKKKKFEKKSILAVF